jgi:hypothetical protein
MGFTYKLISPFLFIMICLIALIPSFWIPIGLEKIFGVVYWFLFVFTYIPSIIFPFFTLSIDQYSLLLLDCFLLCSFFLLHVLSLAPDIKIPKIKISKFLFWSIICILSIISYIAIISIFGLKLNFVALKDIYIQRQQYKETLIENGMLIAYVINWQASIINPFLIGRGIISKNIILLAFGLIGQLLIYSITGFKGVLFSGFLVIAFLFLLRFRGNKFGSYVIWGLVVMIIVFCAICLIFNFQWLASIFIRRNIVIKGLLTGYYFDFFSGHPKVLLGQSIFKSIVNSPYSRDIPYLIGQIYFHDPMMSANANIWADAYANFGYMGLIIFTLILGCVLKIFDSLAKNHDNRIISILIGMPALSLTNSGLLTCLLNHGFLFALMIVYILPKFNKDSLN